MAAVTICSDFGARKNKVCHCFDCFPSICHEVMGPDAMILVFWILSYTLSNGTLWWQPCRLCPSSASVTSPATPWGRSPALWSISLCNRFIHLYVHVKASRTDNHLFSQKEWGQSSLSVGTVPEHWNEVNMAVKESYGCSGFPEHREVMFNYTSLPRV